MPWIVRLRRRLTTPWSRYATGILVGSAAMILTVVFPEFSHRQPFFFFFPAVVIGASIAGFGPGVLIIVVCITGVDYSILAPHEWWAHDSNTLTRLSLFVVAATLISWICELQRRAELDLVRTTVSLRKQVQLAALVSDISIALNNQDSVERMLQSCSEIMLRHLDAAAVRLWSFDPEKKVLILRASAGAAVDEADQQITLEANEIGEIARTRQSQTVELGGSLGDTCQWARREGMRAFAGYPLLINEEVVGVMAIYSRDALADEVVKAMASTANGISLGMRRKQTELELQDLNRTLEQTVAERTEQLSERESELQQTRKMEAIGRLAGGVAHDFNNMLTGILGCSDALEDMVDHEEARLEITEIKKAAERASALTRQLLAFSRRQVMRPKPVQVNDLITTTSKLLVRLIGEDIRLEMHLDPALAHVLADPSQLDQVIMNIALNARDAMPKGGTLQIDTGNLTLEPDTPHVHLGPGDYVVIAISDTGVGMSAQTQARIFEPFFTTKDQGKGTGLGLATADGIVKQMNGTILVYSHLGLGTTFKILLPSTALPGTTVSAPPVLPSTPLTAKKGDTILVVDDEPLVAAYVHRILKRRGYHVILMAHPKEAIKMFETAPKIELVVTDVVLPELNGREMMRTIQAVHPEVRALYMSGYPHEIISHKGILDPDIAFLSKPFHSEDLYAKMRQIFDARPL